MEMQIFENTEFGSVRTIMNNGEPWFVGKDVAEILGYERETKAIVDRVDEDDRFMLTSETQSQFRIELGQRGGWLINESGLYSLILSSKLPKAKEFKRWVTSEVLPSIRRNGGYLAEQETLSDTELMAKALIVAQNALKCREERIKALEGQNASLTVENAIMQPKAEYFDELVDRNLLTNFRETAAELGIGQKKFVDFLIEKKYVYRDKKGKLMPHAKKNDGLFEMRECFNDKSGWCGTRTLITPKGRETFRLLCLC